MLISEVGRGIAGGQFSPLTRESGWRWPRVGPGFALRRAPRSSFTFRRLPAPQLQDFTLGEVAEVLPQVPLMRRSVIEPLTSCLSSNTAYTTCKVSVSGGLR
jgi:hypothetical protein